MPGTYLVDEEGAAITSSNPLPTTPIPGTGATDLGKAEDAAHTSGDTGVMALVVRKDTAAALAGTDGDYAPLEVDASGRLHVNVGVLPALAAGTAIVGKVGIDQTTPGTTNLVQIGGSLPAGTAEIGKLGAGTAMIGAVKDAGTNLTPVNKYGDYTTEQTAATLWDPTGGTKFCITDISVSTATAGTITILDDSTIIREYKLAANGGAVENLKLPLKSALADNILKITTSAALDCFVAIGGYEE